jgi:hypothetical protein
MTLYTNGWMTRQDPDKVQAAIDKLHESDLGREWLSRAQDDEHYALWLYLTDRQVGRVAGVGLFDLEDCLMADGYEAGYSPSEMAGEALANDSTFSEMFEGE